MCQTFQENDTDENGGTAEIISPDVAIVIMDVNVNRNDELPIICKYVKNEMLNAGCQMNEIMRNASCKLVDNNGDKSPVDEILRAIYTTLEQSHSRKKLDKCKNNVNTNNNNNNDNNNNINRDKAGKYAKYQRLFKKDRSKLASEIFDGVDNKAS